MAIRTDGLPKTASNHVTFMGLTGKKRHSSLITTTASRDNQTKPKTRVATTAARRAEAPSLALRVSGGDNVGKVGAMGTGHFERWC